MVVSALKVDHFLGGARVHRFCTASLDVEIPSSFLEVDRVDTTLLSISQQPILDDLLVIGDLSGLRWLL